MRVTDSSCLLWSSDENQCFQLCSTCTCEWKRHRKHPVCFAAAPLTGLSGDWAGFVQLLNWTHWITVVISDLHVHFEHNWWLKMLDEMFGTEENRKKFPFLIICFKNPDSHIYREKKIIFTKMKIDMWELSSTARTLYCLLLDHLWVLLLARRHLGNST